MDMCYYLKKDKPNNIIMRLMTGKYRDIKNSTLPKEIFLDQTSSIYELESIRSKGLFSTKNK